MEVEALLLALVAGLAVWPRLLAQHLAAVAVVVDLLGLGRLPARLDHGEVADVLVLEDVGGVGRAQDEAQFLDWPDMSRGLGVLDGREKPLRQMRGVPVGDAGRAARLDAARRAAPCACVVLAAVQGLVRRVKGCERVRMNRKRVARGGARVTRGGTQRSCHLATCAVGFAEH